MAVSAQPCWLRMSLLAQTRNVLASTGEESSRDIILTKAAECIFGAQPSGLSKAEGSDAGSLSLINVGQSAVKT